MASSQDRLTIPTDLSAFALAAARLPPLDAVPWLIVTLDNLKLLPLDHRAGFIVSFIDGRNTAEMIADMSGMPQVEVLGILADLVACDAIFLRER